jgi:hypothetical protein
LDFKEDAGRRFSWKAADLQKTKISMIKTVLQSALIFSLLQDDHIEVML